MNENTNAVPKLFMVLLGSKAENRNVEQHDFFFGVSHSLAELVPALQAFWPEAGKSLHIDGWREVTAVDGFRVEVYVKQTDDVLAENRLFFINLGGYTAGRLEEQHYTLLSVCRDKAEATQLAKKVAFFKSATIAGMKGANAHIDEKYGIDVDDIHRIEDIWRPLAHENYGIRLVPSDNLVADEVHLGYFRLDRL
ncbi:DUF1543 domain-containing protein [Pedobacter xixiisoli]|nr:DUF1543 domain-containing protein [Pedobacter xixiisoli]